MCKRSCFFLQTWCLFEDWGWIGLHVILMVWKTLIVESSKGVKVCEQKSVFVCRGFPNLRKNAFIILLSSLQTTTCTVCRKYIMLARRANLVATSELAFQDNQVRKALSLDSYAWLNFLWVCESSYYCVVCWCSVYGVRTRTCQKRCLCQVKQISLRFPLQCTFETLVWASYWRLCVHYEHVLNKSWQAWIGKVYVQLLLLNNRVSRARIIFHSPHSIEVHVCL